MSEESNTPPPTVIESTTATIPAPAPQPETAPPAAIPKYKKRVIEMVGLESCGGCQETTEFIEKELKPNSDAVVEFYKYDVNSEKGKEIVKEKNLKYVPHVRECLIPSNENETPVCKEINSYDKKFFKIKVNE